MVIIVRVPNAQYIYIFTCTIKLKFAPNQLESKNGNGQPIEYSMATCLTAYLQAVCVISTLIIVNKGYFPI